MGAWGVAFAAALLGSMLVLAQPADAQVLPPEVDALLQSAQQFLEDLAQQAGAGCLLDLPCIGPFLECLFKRLMNGSCS